MGEESTPIIHQSDSTKVATVHYLNTKQIIIHIVMLMILGLGIAWGIKINALIVIIFLSLGVLGVSASLIFDLYLFLSSKQENKKL